MQASPGLIYGEAQRGSLRKHGNNLVCKNLRLGGLEISSQIRMQCLGRGSPTKSEIFANQIVTMFTYTASLRLTIDQSRRGLYLSLDIGQVAIANWMLFRCLVFPFLHSHIMRREVFNCTRPGQGKLSHPCVNSSLSSLKRILFGSLENGSLLFTSWSFVVFPKQLEPLSH